MSRGVIVYMAKSCKRIGLPSFCKFDPFITLVKKIIITMTHLKMIDSIHKLSVYIHTRAGVLRLRVDDIYDTETHISQHSGGIDGASLLFFFFLFTSPEDEPDAAAGTLTSGAAGAGDGFECHEVKSCLASDFLNA